MQISDPQNRSLVAFSHRILAVFVGLRRNDSEIGLFPLAVGGRSIRAFPFSSGVHRFLSTSNFPLCSILFFSPLARRNSLPAAIPLCRLTGNQEFSFSRWIGIFLCLSLPSSHQKKHTVLFCLCHSVVDCFSVSFYRKRCVFQVILKSVFSARRQRISDFPTASLFLPLCRFILQPLCCSRIKHTLFRQFTRSRFRSRRNATAGDLCHFCFRHWKRPLSLWLSILYHAVLHLSIFRFIS